MNKRVLLYITWVALCSSSALSQCVGAPPSGRQYAWRDFEQVSLKFTNSDRFPSSTEGVINQWNDSRLLNCSIVSFVKTSGIQVAIPLLPKGVLQVVLTTLPDSQFGETAVSSQGGRAFSAQMTLNSNLNGSIPWGQTIAHEIGHTFGLDHCDNPLCPSKSTVMRNPSLDIDKGWAWELANNDDGLFGPCDQDNVVISQWYCSAPPLETWNDPGSAPNECTINNPTLSFSSVMSEKANCNVTGGYWWDDSTCSCLPNASPIIIGNQSATGLTSLFGGVAFDIDGDGTKEQVSWTDSSAQLYFLVLDRDGNGLIDSGRELFGNYSPQPVSREPNGFAALAEFDKSENGGNEDGLIDKRDAIFSHLRLWIDSNHDGTSNQSELFTLTSLGVEALSLSYRDSHSKDKFGNVFRFRSEVLSSTETRLQKWAFDVFLRTSP